MNLLPARRPTPPDETNPQHQEPHRQQKPGHECKVDQRVWLCGPMSFSFSLRRSISLLRRSFLASSSESAIRYSTSSVRWSPALAKGHYAVWTLIGSELRRILLPHTRVNKGRKGILRTSASVLHS